MQQNDSTGLPVERLLRKPRLKSVQLSRKAANLRTPGREGSPLGYDSIFREDISDFTFSYTNAADFKKEEEKKEEEEEDDVGGWQRKRSKRVITVLEPVTNNNTRVEIGFRRKQDPADIPYQLQVILEQSDAIVLSLEFATNDVEKLCEIITEKLKLGYSPKLEYFQVHFGNY